MNSKKYIVSKIDELAKNFPNVKFSYQLDELSETHFIEVLPKDFFEQYDELFVKEQNNIILDFIKKFPTEGLAFITEDDLFTVDNPEYIKHGKEYDGIVPDLSWNHENLDELLTDYLPQIQSSIVIEQVIEEVKQSPIKCTFSFTENNARTDFQKLTNNLSATAVSDIAVDKDVNDEQTYYLAA